MFDFIHRIFICDIEEIRNDIDSGLNAAVDDIAKRRSLTELSLIWLKGELRRSRSKL